MIKRNKPKNVVRLPRIPFPLQAHGFGKEDLIVQNNSSKTKHKAQDSYSKENNTPIDLRNNTIYLEFPIGKKKCTLEFPAELKGQKLSQQSIFATRAACSVFRRDVRARMFKYDQQRAQSLTERSNNYCSVAEHLILRQMLEKNSKREKVVQSYKKQEKSSESRQKLISRKLKFKINENVSRWNDVEARELFQQSNDSLFEQMVQESKVRT